MSKRRQSEQVQAAVKQIPVEIDVLSEQFFKSGSKVSDLPAPKQVLQNSQRASNFETFFFG